MKDEGVLFMNLQMGVDAGHEPLGGSLARLRVEEPPPQRVGRACRDVFEGDGADDEPHSDY